MRFFNKLTSAHPSCPWQACFLALLLGLSLYSSYTWAEQNQSTPEISAETTPKVDPKIAPDATLPEHATPAPIKPPGPATAPLSMSAQHLGELIQIIDSTAQQEGNRWQFQFEERPMYVVCDENADRMRLLTPIVESKLLDESLMRRMLQANYDAVLDPRYAIAKEIVWSVFIHPLASLSEAQFASAVVQVHTAAATFGTRFTSGALVFGGGDSQEHHKRLLDSLNHLLNPST